MELWNFPWKTRARSEGRRNFCEFQGTFKISIIGLGQEDEIEEIALQPEMRWHEADHCMKLPHSAANFCIFWSRLDEGFVVLWTSCYQFICIKHVMYMELLIGLSLHFSVQLKNTIIDHILTCAGHNFVTLPQAFIMPKCTTFPVPGCVNECWVGKWMTTFEKRKKFR